ncbi:MAG: DUF971 domain-containing protein [Microthrixaceae bacterium]|nr:DUF971 domain-containing protein [Microthrixaceae bacterium]
MAEMTPDVTDVTIDTENMELALSFDDGLDGSISLVELRLNCPCATCRAERQLGHEPWPPRGRTDAVLGIKNAGLVGAWGLNVVWSDGHSTGIYPFEELHAWIRRGYPEFRPDSGLGS